MNQRTVELNQTTPYVCECGGGVFTSVFYLRRVSELVTGGKGGISPIPAWKCIHCDKVQVELLPVGMA